MAKKKVENLDDLLIEEAKKGSTAKKSFNIRDELIKALKKKETRKEFVEGLLKSASKGNAKSAEMVLKIIGEDPNKQEQDMENNPFV